MTSSVTRLIIHLTKLGGQAGPCPTIPDAIHEECKAKYLPLKTRRGIARALEEVVPPDCDLSDSGDDASPSASVASGVAASSGGGSSSSFKKKASSQGGRPPKQAKQATLAQVVNADECKLSVETLKSLNKDRDPEEEQIFRELYMEPEEIDRRVSRTRSRKKVVVRGSATRGRGSSTSTVRGGGRASTRAPTTYVRRGSGSGSSTTATTLENVPLSRSTEPREPEFDDDGNILSERDYGLFSTYFDTSSDEDDTHDDSDWETDTST
ncbi:hypothetical protein L7F22_004187 [Adiantum nelumboides]|nr:hypothetical protein [Adiantum nelumboides]